MEINEILRTSAGYHPGYQLQQIAVSLMTDDEVKVLPKLQVVPNKVSAFLQRDKISTVHKFNMLPDDVGTYIVTATDGTKFIIEY